MCKYGVFESSKILKKNCEKFIKEMLDDRTNNPDGSGIYFYNPKSNKSLVQKFYGITKNNVIEDVLKKCVDNFVTGSLLIYHNRGSTSGEKSKSQCHPIPIEHCDERGINLFQGGYIIHNGVLPDFEVAGVNNLSDTQIVARSIGQWMYDHNIKSPRDFGEKRGKEYGETVFAGSKVTIVCRNEYCTINDNLGVIEDGVGKSSGTTKYGVYASQEEISEGEKQGLESYYKNKHGEVTTVKDSIPDYDPNHKN